MPQNSISDLINQRLDPAPASGLLDRINSRLGAKPESETMAWQVNQQELGAPGMGDLGLRFKINAADTFNEKLGAFKAAYPQGDLTKDIMSDTLLFRPDPSQPYAKVDADFLEKAEPLADLIDFTASDLGAISGEMIAAARTRGVSLIGLMARLFAGGSLGEAAQEGVEPMMGVPQQETVSEIAPRAAGKGVVGAVGGAVGMGIEKGINAVRGAGVMGIKPEAEGAMQAAERMGLPPLMPQQVTTSPFVQRIGAQSSAVSETIPRLVYEQEAALTARLNGLRDPASAENFIGEVTGLLAKERKEILSRGIAAGTDAADAGQALIEGRARYEIMSKNYVDAAYQAARKIGTPEFDLSPVYRAIDDITAGAPAMGAKGEIQGQPPLPKPLQEVIKKLRDFDPSAPDIIKDGKVFTKTDFLKSLRSQLWDLKTPPVGEPIRQEQALAGKMYKAITDVMDNPVNADPGFVSAWKSASNAARERFDTLEKNIVIETGRTQTPEVLADRLARPLNSSNLSILRAVTGVTKYFKMQDFFKTKLVENADDITRTIGQFDDKTLGMLLSPDEQAAYREIGNRIDRLNSMKIESAIERSKGPVEAVKNAILTGSAERSAELYKMVSKSGGPNGDVGKAIRGAIIENIWSDVMRIPKGEAAEMAVRQTLATKLTQIKHAGADKFLTPGDISDLRDLHIYKSMIDGGTDTGASIQAAETISGAARFNAAAMIKLAHYAGMGRLITSGAGRKFLTGSGAKKLDAPKLKAFSGALATLAADFDED